MRRKLLLSLIVVSLFTICLAVGCSGSKGPQPLVLKESGYQISDSGYVYYAVGIENPNQDKAAQSATVSVVGKDADGKIVFSDDWVLSDILAGKVNYFASQAGNGTTPDTVEIELLPVKDDKWVPQNQVVDLYTITNTNAVDDEWFPSFTGEVTADYVLNNQETALISVVLRDGDGAIVGAAFTFVDGLSKGSTRAFEARVYDDLPEYASFDVYAQPWY